MSMQIQNPVRPGFHADPSLCRIGDDGVLGARSSATHCAADLEHHGCTPLDA